MNRSNHVHGLLALIVAVAVTTPAMADPAAERAAALANTTCAACHGANGLSISETIPNLAGQRAGYLENQLKALREGSRKSGVMNAIAEQLGEADLKPLAAHYAALPAVPAGAPARRRGCSPTPALSAANQGRAIRKLSSRA
jgi:cytochrome c553